MDRIWDGQDGKKYNENKINHLLFFQFFSMTCPRHILIFGILIGVKF